MKKLLVFGVIVLFLGVAIAPSINANVKQITMSTNSGNILYVGGNGTGNYSKIQDAIDDASDGDTVFVYNDSSPYYENINIGKSIKLIGEDRDTTIIDGNASGDVVYVSADGINISGFTIKESRQDTAGIAVYSDYNTISSNKISCGISHCYGIWLHWNTSFNTIKDNIISYNRYGVDIDGSNANSISGNIISNNYYGIYLSSANNNKITDNNITSNRWCGILLVGSNNNISRNVISHNGKDLIQHGGILLYYGYKNKILKNNFINNSRNSYFQLLLSMIFEGNIWNENYWDKPSRFPYLIFGRMQLIFIQEIKFPWIYIDWHPAKEPYDIEV